jgi:hypothetical protein
MKYHPTNTAYTFLDTYKVATGPQAGRHCVRWQTAYMPVTAFSYYDTLAEAASKWPLVQDRVITTQELEKTR